MFAIYNIEGRRFRDTLENMRKVRKSLATPGMQLRSNVSEDETQPIPDVDILKCSSPLLDKADHKVIQG